MYGTTLRNLQSIIVFHASAEVLRHCVFMTRSHLNNQENDDTRHGSMYLSYQLLGTRTVENEEFEVSLGYIDRPC